MLAVALVASPVLFAQVTTSAINGAVKNNENEPLVGATIVATHQPSGTKYTTVSRAGGQYGIQNMRVGGPYLVEVSYVGHASEKYDNIYIQLAESFLLNPVLTKSSAALQGVTVSSARKNSILNAGRTGAVSSFNSRQIGTLPSISRSINDITRGTPQSNGASIGGGNYRQNNFTVDGSDFNNSFGIGTNLPAGGTPISLDALDEISVSITPFDVRQSGFIGASVNAVTRSGTNTFKGTVYNYFRNEKQRGDQVDKTKFIRPAEEFKQYGFSVGGPIIKNKLFFFFNYENEKQPKALQTMVAATAAAAYGSAPNIARPTADSLNYISKYLQDKYGYATGPFQGYTPNIERTKYTLRLDWNINSKNRLNVRYSQVEGGEPYTPSTSVSGSGVVYNSTRTASTAMWFKNSNYYQGANLYSFAAELNSNWGRFANTLRGTYTYQNDSRSTDSQIFPFVDIMSSGGVSASSPYTSFGYEPFSFGNLRQVKTYSVIDNLIWNAGKHRFTVGGQFDLSQTINGFQRFATSYYVFNTWADFESALNPNPALRAKPRDFAITYSLSPNFAPAFSAFKFVQYSAYGQDEISVNKDLKVTLGLRVDLPTYPDVPQIVTHPLVYAQTFDQGEKINTGILPKKRLMWSPRVGFNWDIYGDRSLQFRGGTGIFTGKVPFVWIVAQSGDNGMLQIIRNYNGQANTPGPFNPDPAAYRPSTVPVAGTIVPANITALDPNFRFPQSWKTTLAVDKKLGNGLIGTIEAVYNKDLITAYFRNPNMITPQKLNTTGYPDVNRLMYGATVPTRFINTLNSSAVFASGGTSAFNPIVLDNGYRGFYFSLTTRVEKTFNKGFSASVAYTKNLAANLFDGGGDQTLSAWQGTPTVNGTNYAKLSYTDYVQPDRVIAMFSYRKEYIKHMATTISAFYNGSTNGRFSYVYSGDYNRDGVSGNDLIYIPTAAEVKSMQFVTLTQNGVNYDQTAQRAIFENFIGQDKYLRAHRGQYAERNGGQYPWLNRVDVKILQDLFSNISKTKHTLQFSIDITNFGNLLNPSWGKLKSLNTGSILVPQNQTSLVAGGSVLPTFKLGTANGDVINKTFRDNVSIASTYNIQFGIRYIFN
jgi:hypothetical protein